MDSLVSETDLKTLVYTLFSCYADCCHAMRYRNFELLLYLTPSIYFEWEGCHLALAMQSVTVTNHDTTCVTIRAQTGLCRRGTSNKLLTHLFSNTISSGQSDHSKQVKILRGYNENTPAHARHSRSSQVVSLPSLHYVLTMCTCRVHARDRFQHNGVSPEYCSLAAAALIRLCTSDRSCSYHQNILPYRHPRPSPWSLMAIILPNNCAASCILLD